MMQVVKQNFLLMHHHGLGAVLMQLQDAACVNISFFKVKIPFFFIEI